VRVPAPPVASTKQKNCQRSKASSHSARSSRAENFPVSNGFLWRKNKSIAVPVCYALRFMVDDFIVMPVSGSSPIRQTNRVYKTGSRFPIPYKWCATLIVMPHCELLLILQPIFCHHLPQGLFTVDQMSAACALPSHCRKMLGKTPAAVPQIICHAKSKRMARKLVGSLSMESMY